MNPNAAAVVDKIWHSYIYVSRLVKAEMLKVYTNRALIFSSKFWPNCLPSQKLKQINCSHNNWVQTFQFLRQLN